MATPWTFLSSDPAEAAEGAPAGEHTIATESVDGTPARDCNTGPTNGPHSGEKLVATSH